VSGDREDRKGEGMDGAVMEDEDPTDPIKDIPMSQAEGAWGGSRMIQGSGRRLIFSSHPTTEPDTGLEDDLDWEEMKEALSQEAGAIVNKSREGAEKSLQKLFEDNIENERYNDGELVGALLFLPVSQTLKP